MGSRDPYRELKAAHGRLARPSRRVADLQDEIARLARDSLRAKLDLTKDEGLDCGECHGLLDRFAEMHAVGEDVHALMPLVYLHLQACGDCCRELETARRAVVATR